MYVRTNDGIYRGAYESVLDKMRPRHKDIYLRHKAGETFVDIAKSYGLSPWTIRNNYATARNFIDWMCNHQNYAHGETIKTADTIEDLCDKFVVVNRTCEDQRIVFDELTDAISFTEMYDIPYYEIFGAIWIQTGLKFVALLEEGKMHLWDFYKGVMRDESKEHKEGS